jgi:hypothetical protein
MKKQTYDLEERLLEYSVRIIKIVEQLPNTRADNHVAGQLLRSGSSPYPNHGEANAVESPKDFINKLRISLLDVCFFISRLGVIGRSMFDLPAMPLGGLGKMPSCLGPVTMIISPSFVMHGRRVFDVHLLKQARMA